MKTKKPYLIQRCKIRTNPTGETFDGVFQLDYMGSAEFEFGALPESLKQVCRELDNFKSIEVDNVNNFKDQVLCVVAPQGVADEYISSYMAILLDEKVRTKESTHLKAMFSGVGFGGERVVEGSWQWVDVWWDIENNLFFCFSDKRADLILRALKATKDKKKNEKAVGWY